MMNGQYWGMACGMWFVPVLFITLIIVIVVFLYKSNNASIQNETALEILKKRYAIGEITKEHFEEMKNNIS